MRAAPVLAQNGVDVAGLCEAMAGEDLAWNVKKASVYGVSVGVWLEALNVAGLRECEMLGELLRLMHRTDARRRCCARGISRGGVTPASLAGRGD